MPDEDKLRMIVALVHGMTQEFKDKVLAELLGGNAAGEAQVIVNSNADSVKVDFGRPLRWFVIPKPYAIQLGASLMQHGGATLQQVQQPGPNAQ